MPKLTREKALAAMRAAGAGNDKQAFTRLYVENRIALKAANAAWVDGARFRAFCDRRDAATAKVEA